MTKITKKAFTLIELLVVVAIIGILATVIIINVSNAQSKAKDAKVKSNLTQINKLMTIYGNTNGPFLPFNCSVGGTKCDELTGTADELQQVKTLAADIKSILNNGEELTINSTAKSYLASAKLPSTSNSSDPQSIVASSSGSTSQGNSYEGGMVGWWKLADATDSSIYGFNGTLSATGSAFSSTTLPNGSSGNALIITGNSGHLAVADRIELRANKFSYSLWFKRNQIGDYRAMLSKNGPGNNPKFGIYTLNTNSFYGLEVGNDTTGTTVWSNNVNSLNTTGSWFHLVVTYDGVKFRVYHNGASVLEQERSYNPSLNSYPLIIGALWGGSNSLMGQMANARFYNRVLSANEVKDLYDDKN